MVTTELTGLDDGRQTGEPGGTGLRSLFMSLTGDDASFSPFSSLWEDVVDVVVEDAVVLDLSCSALSRALRFKDLGSYPTTCPSSPIEAMALRRMGLPILMRVLTSLLGFVTATLAN